MTIIHKSVPALSPSNPNIRPGTDIVPISPIALWPISIIPAVHDLPGSLVLKRLEDAITQVTALWPTVAGRYHWDADEQFDIQLTSSSIPLDYQTLQSDTVFPTKDVIQPSLEPFLTHLHSDYHMPNSGHPLLAIRLTVLEPSNRCILGITWAHVLGDAFACNLFIRHLAWLYVQSDDSSGEVPHSDRPPLPAFFPHVDLPSDSRLLSIADSKRYQIHQITQSYPPAVTSKLYKQGSLNSDCVVVSLTRKELTRMVEEFRELAEGSGGLLSSLDVISGWWIGVLQRTGVEIHRVIYTINYRTLYKSSQNFPPHLSTIASNAAQMLAIPLPLHHSVTTEGITPIPVFAAQAIREALQMLRSDEGEGLSWLSCIADSLKAAAVRCEGNWYCQSRARFDWNIPFGFPVDQTAFYTSGSGLHVLRVCEANPLPGQKFGETNVELTFRVQKGIKDITENIIKADRRRWN